MPTSIRVFLQAVSIIEIATKVLERHVFKACAVQLALSHFGARKTSNFITFSFELPSSQVVKTQLSKFSGLDCNDNFMMHTQSHEEKGKSYTENKTNSNC